MGKAFKCDMTGELAEGDGVREIDIDISKTLRLRVTPLVKVGNDFHQATLGPKARHDIEQAVLKLQAK